MTTRAASDDQTRHELVSARGAATLLAEVGVGRETARRILGSGLAGVPDVVGGTHVYERSRVERLKRWPALDADAVAEACLRGTFVARLGPRKAITGATTGRCWTGADVLAPPTEQLRAASGPWRISPLGCVRLLARMDQEGFVPFVATVGGFVVLVANMTDVQRLGTGARPAVRSRAVRRHAVELTLSAAGGWADAWVERRIVTAAGGPWLVWPNGLWGDLRMWGGAGGRTTIGA